MNRLRYVGLLIIPLLALIVTSASGQGRVGRTVLGAGGGSSGNGVTRISATVGQNAVGDARLIGRIIQQGFWHHAGSSVAAGTEPREAAVTGSRRLAGNIWPNPSAGSADLVIDIPAAGNVTAALYDMRGNSVRTLYEGTAQSGALTIPLDGTDLASGVYTVVITTGLERAMVVFHLVR